MDNSNMQRIVDSGNAYIITGGGYTFMSDGEGSHLYFASGTFPGCLRGGKEPDLNKLKGIFREINLQEVVCKKGYFPEFYGYNSFIMRYMCNSDDYSVDFDILNKFCADSPYKTDDLKNPMKSSKIFKVSFEKTA